MTKARLATAVLGLLALAGCGGEGGTTQVTPSIGDTNDVSAPAHEPIGVATQELIASPVGSPWNFGCSNPAWQNYLQVPYTGRTAIPVYINGAGMNQVTSVSWNPSTGYSIPTATIVSPSQIKLDVRAVNMGEGGTAPTTLPLTFANPGGTFIVNVNLIPAFNVDNQAYGQCTWHAEAERSDVSSYAQGIALGANPSGNAFPRAGSVLMGVQDATHKHMVYVTSVAQTSAVTAGDGSVTYTYAIAYSQRNADCKSSLSNSSTQMTVKKSKAGAWTMITPPKAVYPITNIVQ